MNKIFYELRELNSDGGSHFLKKIESPALPRSGDIIRIPVSNPIDPNMTDIKEYTVVRVVHNTTPAKVGFFDVNKISVIATPVD